MIYALAKIKINQNGFSMMEVIIAIALVSIISLGLIQLGHNNNEALRKIEGQWNRVVLYETISKNLTYRDSCLKAFSVGNAAVVKLNTATATTHVGQEIDLKIAALNAGLGLNLDTLTSNNLGDANILMRQKLNIESVNAFDMSAAPLPIPGLPANEEVRRVFLKVATSIRNVDGNTGLSTRYRTLASLILKLDNTTAPDLKVIDCLSAANQSLEDVCNGLGGDYDAARVPPCRFFAAPFDCGPGLMWTQVDPAGIPECSPVRLTCPAGSYLRGPGVNFAPANCHDPEFAN